MRGVPVTVPVPSKGLGACIDRGGKDSGCVRFSDTVIQNRRISFFPDPSPLPRRIKTYAKALAFVGSQCQAAFRRPPLRVFAWSAFSAGGAPLWSEIHPRTVRPAVRCIEGRCTLYSTSQFGNHQPAKPSRPDFFYAVEGSFAAGPDGNPAGPAMPQLFAGESRGFVW